MVRKRKSSQSILKNRRYIFPTKKFISTTLPYVNSKPHIGHAFEFILGDVIARYYRKLLQPENVIFNVGVDEHGIKVQQAAEAAGKDPQDYCDELADLWIDFCSKFQISYDSFYRTSSSLHKKRSIQYFNDLKESPDTLYKKNYTGKYCVGCETFKTDKEIIDNRCEIHGTELQTLSEENWFLNLHKFAPNIKDILVDKSLSQELKNTIQDFKEISVTRQNVDWAVQLGDNTSLYVWEEALKNYVFAAGYPNKTDFLEYWENALIICGKDNLKFQAYVLQALCLANGIPQNKEVLVHGTILDMHGKKMSKTVGNVIDPIEQLEKFGISPLRFYFFGQLITFGDSSYAEIDVIDFWNSRVVDVWGNLLSRALHLIDLKQIDIIPSDQRHQLEISQKYKALDQLFEEYSFRTFTRTLFEYTTNLNKRISIEKPYAKDCQDPQRILSEIYHELVILESYYSLIIPEYELITQDALKNKRKVILFKKLEEI